MVNKVVLYAVCLLLAVLIFSTTKFYISNHLTKPVDQTKAHLLSYKEQLQTLNQTHPLLALYEDAKAAENKTLDALTTWQKNNQQAQTIESIYVLWIKRRIAAKKSDSLLVSELDTQLAEIATTQKLLWLEAWLIHNQAKDAIRSNEVDKAVSFIQQAISIAETNHYSFLLIDFYNTAAIIFNAQNKLIHAQQYFLKGLKILESTPDATKRVIFNNNLGLLYIHLEQWHDALNYLANAESLHLKNAVNNIELLSVIFFNQSFAYNRLGKLEESRVKYEAGLQIIDSNSSRFIQVLALKTQARLEYLEKRYAQAIMTSERCLNQAIEYKFKKQAGICALELSYALQANEQNHEALMHANNALKRFEEIAHPRWVIKSHLLLAKLNEKVDNPALSLEFYKHYYSQERALLFGELRELDNAMEIQQIAQERDLLNSKNQIAQLETQFSQQRFQLMTLWLVVIVCIMFWVVWQSIRIKQDNKRLYDLSYKDPLTGAANRHLYQKELESPTKLNPEKDYRLIVVDLDHFKQVNDNFGHDKGDIVLKETARRLMAFVEQDELFVRWGGEEFLIVVKERQNFREFAQSLVIAINREPIDLGEDTLAVTASFGCSHREKYQTIQHSNTTFKLADQCLYQAKETGRNRVVLPQDLQA